MKEHSTYSHILKYTSLFGSIQMITILANIVRNKVMAVFLGTTGMGLNTMLYTAQTFASQCTNLGLSFGAVPRLSDDYEHGNAEKIRYSIQVIRLWSLITSVFGFLFCLAISPLLGNYTFTWGHFYHHYAVLGLSVAAMAITGGETAILKATRRLKLLARVQSYTALASIIISVPLYYYMAYSGILPAIILMAFFACLATIVCSFHCYPFKMDFSRTMLRDGMSMIRLGLALVLAAALGSGSELLIRSYLNVEGDLPDVGLYNAAYMIVVTYGGMVFSSLEVDYFPRLSAVSKDVAATNETVNKQIEVSLLLLAPMLVGLLIFLPVLVPLLFSSQFIPVVAMAQVAVLAMYFKVLTMPVSYITLARSRSLAFLFLESTYFLALVVSIVLGYTYWGLFGTGIAIVTAHAFEFLTTSSYAYWRLGYRCTWMIGRYATVQVVIGVTAYVVSVVTDGWLYWTTEAALTLASTAYSIHVLRQKTRLWEALRQKLGSRFGI